MVNGVLQATPCGGLFNHTCEALSHIPELRVLNGQVKLSRLVPGTHVRPHCGPTNARLRMHCAIELPLEGPSVAQLRVGDEHYSWQEGECIVFDESCEHEVTVSKKAMSSRIVLILDFVNPLLANETDYFNNMAHSVLLSDQPASLKKWTEGMLLKRYRDTQERLLFYDIPITSHQDSKVRGLHV